MPRTSHDTVIAALRQQVVAKISGDTEKAISYALAADLLEMHDDTGISLDNWENAKDFIEWQTADAGLTFSLAPNGA